MDAPAGKRPLITDLVGVILWTDHLEDMRHFYQELLGLTLHSHHNDFITFEVRPGLRLSIGTHNRVHGHNPDPHRIMVNLGVEDIHAAAQRLTAQGVEFLRPPEQEAWGGWVATFRDPDGNLLQLLELPRQ
ncbi:MAG: VOC family protein [Chloroflexi bacterium]|nr:VOC family protein [Chloroflexota bacterium]